MKVTKLALVAIIGTCLLAGCGAAAFPEEDFSNVQKAVNPERLFEDETEEVLEADSEENAAAEEVLESDSEEERLTFSIGNWDVLYGSWMDLENNAYTFSQDGSYSFTPYDTGVEVTGSYTIETVEEKDYLLMLSEEGEEIRYELGFVRAGVALYSTEEGKETELAAYLLSMM